MATTRTNKTNKTQGEKFFATWKLIAMIGSTAAGIATTFFIIGKTVESTQSNLEATRAMQQCNERVEVERQKVTDLRNQINEKRVNDLTKTVELLQQNTKIGQ